MDYEKYYINIGKNVKELRTAKGWSQKELALKMGLKSQTFISKAEKGIEKRFGIEHIIKMCDVFECRINDIVGIDVNNMPSEWLDETIYHETE